jgi:hypothetical protein
MAPSVMAPAGQGLQSEPARLEKKRSGQGAQAVAPSGAEEPASQGTAAASPVALHLKPAPQGWHTAEELELLVAPKLPSRQGVQAGLRPSR